MSCSFLLSELVEKESYSDFKWFPHKYSLLFLKNKTLITILRMLIQISLLLLIPWMPVQMLCERGLLQLRGRFTLVVRHIIDRAPGIQPHESQKLESTAKLMLKKKISPVTTASTFNYNVLKVTILFCHPTRCLKNEIAAFYF